jgi:hypothetical protein
MARKFSPAATPEKKMRVRPNSYLIGCRLRVMLIFGESHPGFFSGGHRSYTGCTIQERDAA